MALQSYQMLAFEWSMLVITFFLVVLRLYIRWPTEIRPLRKGCIADLLVLFAWLSFLEQGCLDIVISKTIFFDDVWADNVPWPDRQWANKVWWIENMTYLNCMYAVKCSLLLFYHESFPHPGVGDSTYGDWRWLRRCLWAVDVIVLGGWLFYFIATLSMCRPISSNWSPDPEKFCSYANFAWYTPAVFVWHCFTDAIVYLLPFALLRTLHVPGRIKIGLGVTFFVGFLSIACAIVLEVGYQIGEIPQIKLFMLNILEQTFAVIAGCLPVLRAIVEAKAKPSSIPQNEGNRKEVSVPEVLHEARMHSNWMRDVMIRESVKRSEMTSMRESEALEKAKRISPMNSVRAARVVVQPNDVNVNVTRTSTITTSATVSDFSKNSRDFSSSPR